jgi:hypothetical protein
LPLNDAGKAAYAKNMAGLKDGSITDEARKFCVPDGVPRVGKSISVRDREWTARPGHDPYELSHQIA